MFDAFRSMEFTDDLNTLELLRLTTFLGVGIHEYLIENFDRLFRSIFGMVWTVPLFEEWTFAAFFDAFYDVLVSHINLLESLLENAAFRRLLVVAIRSALPSALSLFSTIVVHSKINYVSLVRDNFDVIASQHTINALQLIRKSGLELNDDMFSRLFLSILSELPEQVLSIAAQKVMKRSVDFLGSLNESHKLTNVDDLAATTPAFIERLATVPHSLTSELMIKVMLLAWDNSREYRPFLSRALGRFDKVTASVLALRVCLSLRETDDVTEHSAVAAAAAARIPELVNDGVLLRALTKVLEREGVEAHCTWVPDAFLSLSKGRLVTAEVGEFLGALAAGMDEDVLVDAVATMARGSQAEHLPLVLARLEAVVAAKKDIKWRLLEAAGIGKEKFTFLGRTWRTRYPRLFADWQAQAIDVTIKN
jgi:hypothetical protein